LFYTVTDKANYIFTVPQQTRDSSFLTVNFSAKFQREHKERGCWM